MTPDATLIVELMLLGLGTGFLAGLLGVGGGLMMVPFLTYLLTVRGLLHGGFDLAGIGAQCLPDVGVIGDVVQQVAEEIGRRLVACDQQ